MPLENVQTTDQAASVPIERVGIVGCGLMGSGIAEVCARAGLDVVVHEQDEEALGRGRQRVEASLARALDADKIDRDAHDRARDHLRFTTDLTSMADRQLVIEAVTEQEEVKLDVFAALDEVVLAEDAVLASNTSSIPIMKLAMATRRPASVLGMHFFNPVPILHLVELVPSMLTDEQVVQHMATFATDHLGKRVIRSQDRAGFIVNALLIPYLLSAIRMLESGFATAEDIDTGMVVGCNMPMGPLALADLIGLDTTAAIAESLYVEFKEPLFAASPMLTRMVDAGLLGRKSGRGFYEYS